MPPTVAASRPPTALLGTMDEGRYYALSVDFAETVPDVVWPLSVQTFSAMRNDPALSAVLSAVMLPIRRATWAVDPTGCRAEVAQLVADDLGVPLLGEDKPTAARTRGVSWPEHLRSALLYLVYGHAGFEMLADVSGDRARLVGLYERVQHTISFIHSTATGDFGGVSQFYHPDREEAPEIPPERMVFYCHAREGSAWHGRSMLRPAFAPWLLKRECQRILATSARRFGMGVPTVEWAAGTVPTPEQMTAAQQAASAARVGEQAGLAMPPGSQLVLKGLSGGTPDVLAFIKWLNTEMSKMALAQFLDLGGESSHGSRALGTAFIDLFTLSIAAVGEEIADQVTRQGAARLVEWNYGQDEPVPAVVVTDIGTKHEITADALLQLMQAGAITADPALEEYVRKAYQLPARSLPWVAPPRPRGTSPVDAGAAGQGGDAVPVAAARPLRGRGKPASSEQLALPIAAADGTDPTPEMDPGHQKAWQTALADLQKQWPDLAAPMVNDLAQQAAGGVDRGDLAALGALTVSALVVGVIADAIAGAMTGLAATAAGHVVAEAKAQGRRINAPADPGADRIGQIAHAVAGVLANGYASAAARKALQVASATATAADVHAAVAQVLTDMGTADAGWVADNLGAALNAGQNAGRFAVLEAHPPKYLLADENHDDANRCQPCAEVNRKRYETLAEAEADYPSAGYVGCLGGLRCRGHVVGVWK